MMSKKRETHKNSNIQAIRDVWKRAEQNKMTFKKNKPGERIKKSLGRETYEKYRAETEAYNNWLEKKYGHGIAKSSNKKAKEYLDELEKNGVGVFRLKAIVHSLANFREATKTTGVFKYQVKCGNKEEILKDYKDRGLQRKSSDSKRLIPTQSECREVLENLERKNESNNKQEYINAAKLQYLTSARIEGSVSITAGDVKFDVAGYAAMVRYCEKGKHTRHVPIYHHEKEAIELLKGLTAGKEDGTPLVRIKNREDANGIERDKSKKESIKQFSDNVSRAGAGVTERHKHENKKFSNHSFRSGFAVGRMDMYANQKPSDLKKEIKRRIEYDNMLEENQKSHLQKKYQSYLKSIRNKIARSEKDPIKKQELRKERELNHKEMCLWLTSIDLGHGRGDIVRFYAPYPGALYKNKKS